MLLSIAQASKELGLSPGHIRKQIKSGRWPSYRLGDKALRVDVEEIRALGRMVEAWKREQKGVKTEG